MTGAAGARQALREDLYYRLNVITVTTPPLRDKREDIRVLAQHFLRVYAAKNNRVLEGFTDEALGCLEAYRWPGNVRELENVVERAVVLARGAVIEAANLPPNVTERSVTFTRVEPAGGPAAPGAGPDGVFTIRIGTPLAEVDQRVLEETLRFAKGNRTVTAKLLGIDPRRFRKLKQVEARRPGRILDPARDLTGGLEQILDDAPAASLPSRSIGRRSSTRSRPC